MRRADRRAGREAGRRSGQRPGGRSGAIRAAGGAPGGASSPFRPVRTRTGFPRARRGTELAIPSRLGARLRPGGGTRNPKISPQGSRKPSGVSRRSIPVWEKEKGTGGAHAEQNNRAAERWLTLPSFRVSEQRERGPESITPTLSM